MTVDASWKRMLATVVYMPGWVLTAPLNASPAMPPPVIEEREKQNRLRDMSRERLLLEMGRFPCK